jgi:hypothetical protein
MGNCINVICFDKGDTILEERHIGEDFGTATVTFIIKNRDGLVIGECLSIPVQSLFDITRLINLSIKEKILRTEQFLESLKKETKRGTEENQAK